MKILKELILNGEFIISDVPELSNLRFKLDYDQDNNAFKIGITPIDLTKSPSSEHRKRAFAKLAEIFNEESSGSVSKEGHSLKIEMASLIINHHGLEWLSRQIELAETIELLKLIAKLQTTKSSLAHITPDLVKFLNSDNSYSSQGESIDSQFTYQFSDKFSHSYQMRLIKVYSQRLNELLRLKFTYKPDENTGVSYTEKPAILFITQLAMERLHKIFNTPNPLIANAKTALKELETAAANNRAETESALKEFQAENESALKELQTAVDKNQAKLVETRSLLSSAQAIAQSLLLPSSSQSNHTPPTSNHLVTAPITAAPAVKPATAGNIEAISSQSNKNIAIDLELLFSTGELLIEDNGHHYMASYYYDLELHQINIEVKNEKQSNIAKDELSPRSANCQQLAENIYKDIIHKYALPLDAEIYLDKSKNKISFKDQVISKVFSANDSEKTSNLLKTIKLLSNSDPIECNKLLIDITSNKNKYFRCMVVGDNYEITCEYGNTQFKTNPGISERMSSDLSNLLRIGLTHLVSEKYPELHNKLDIKSPGKKVSNNYYTFVVNKKACDDVLIKTYLSSQPELPLTKAQFNLSLENAKKQLDAFLVPFKDRHLNPSNLADLKDRMKNGVRCLFTWMDVNDLESICQFYEYLKTPGIFKYLNAHKNTIYDSIFSKDNTNTWQETMKIFKDDAFRILKAKAAVLEGSPEDKAKFLDNYRNRQIFTDHRENKFLNRFHSTQTVKEIDKLIASYRAPQIKTK